MIDTISNMQKTVDQTCPKRYAHVKFVGTPYDRKKKFEIDNQNQKLLGKIMQIMKRKNKSVQQARAAPPRIVGGSDAHMNRYPDSSSFRNTLAEHSYTGAGSTINTTKPNTSILSTRADKRSASIDTRKQAASHRVAEAEEAMQGPHDQMAENSSAMDAQPGEKGEGLGSATDQLNQGSFVMSQNVESGVIGSAKQSQLDHHLHSMPKATESGERQLSMVSKRKSHGVGGYATISDQFDLQEDSAFLAKRSTLRSQKDRGPSLSSFNPVMMRGSLNCGYRKHEMIRINQGNKVSLINQVLLNLTEIDSVGIS